MGLGLGFGLDYVGQVSVCNKSVCAFLFCFMRSVLLFCFAFVLSLSGLYCIVLSKESRFEVNSIQFNSIGFQYQFGYYERLVVPVIVIIPLITKANRKNRETRETHFYFTGMWDMHHVSSRLLARVHKSFDRILGCIS